MRVYMKKGFVLLLMFLLLGAAACGENTEDKPQSNNVTEQPGESQNNMTEQPDDQQSDVTEQPVELEKAELKRFTYGGITTRQTKIKTKHLELNIPANVYIPNNMVENIDIMTSAMETVSGMKFEGNPKYNMGPLMVDVEKMTDTESEFGAAYAYPGGFVLSSGDLINLFALVHEGSHSLQWNQSTWAYCTWAMEGISTYTTYKTQAYIEQNHPELVPIIGNVNLSFLNYGIENYDELYKYPMEHWVENTFEYAGNGNYAIGFHFMWYLDEVYGDYTKWIFEYEKANPYYLSNAVSNELAPEEQIKAFYTAYGEDVFEKFYAWVKDNRERFQMGHVVDLSNAGKLQLYPLCEYSGIYYNTVFEFRYQDLMVGIDEGREYLKEYKGKNTQHMVLNVDNGVVLELYDAEGKLMRVEGPIQSNQPVVLEGVSSLKLVGNGTLTQFTVTGFENYE